MSLIIFESCDFDNVNPYAGTKWELLGPNLILQTIGGKTGYRMWDNDDAMVKVFPSQEDDTIIVGARYYGDYSVLSAGNGMFTFREGESTTGTWHLTLYSDANGVLEVRRGSATTLGRTANFVFPNTGWFYVEMKVVIHDSAGTVEVRVDNNVVLNLTGQDTRNAGTDGLIDTVGIGGRFTSWTVRDIYILNGLGSTLNDFLGPQVMQSRVVDGAGDSTQWTPNTGSNFQAVDETNPDDDTTYVESDVAAERDSYTVTDFTIPDTINAVQSFCIPRYLDAPLDVATYLRRSSTNADGTAETPAGGYGSRGFEVWETDPIAAAAWTLTNLNGTQVGIVSS